MTLEALASTSNHLATVVLLHALRDAIRARDWDAVDDALAALERY